MELPRFVEVRQNFPDDAITDCAEAVRRELDRIGAAATLKQGARVAIAVGSRGIDRYAEIVRAAASFAVHAGAVPFIVPAMGSHAGGTAESQAAILLEQGIGVRGFPAPIRSSVQTISLGRSEQGDEVLFDAAAARADLLIVINRIKAHTDFEAPVESGVAKMLVVGLGKPAGARAAHRSFRRHGFYPTLRSGVGLILRRLPAVIGIAVVENETHRAMRVEAMHGPEILGREQSLLRLSRERMARLPVEQLDLLVVEEIGKNISGSGMDTNVISRKRDPGRSVAADRPKIDYIYVRSLSPESHGNAVGIGLADYCGEAVMRDIDLEITYLNCLTSGTPRGAAIPVHLGTDRRTVEAVSGSLPLESPDALRAAWIRNTLALDRFYVTEAVLRERDADAFLEPVSEPRTLRYDANGNLANPFVHAAAAQNQEDP
jgi:hypothetical protein